MKTSTIKNVARKAVFGVILAAGLVGTTGCDPYSTAGSLAGLGGYGGTTYRAPSLTLPSLSLPPLPVPYFPF